MYVSSEMTFYGLKNAFRTTVCSSVYFMRITGVR
jgi:hypothetical protein